MTTYASRMVEIVFDGDVDCTLAFDAARDTDYRSVSPASNYPFDLAAGNNEVGVPSGATAVTIVKPPDNTAAITFKGANGDTGVRLHDTDPDSISLDSSVTSFVLNASAEVTVRLVFS